MSFVLKKKILFISHEFDPYNIETNMAEVLNQLAVLSNKEGYEVRCIMPRFGTINERRHKLHEVVRLSGININVDKEDYPLIIKVASLPNARLQMYFMDNEDMFKRKQVFYDEEGKFFGDNAERTIFFCKGAIETVKKFGWPPDIIFIHGWMAGLVPMFIKTHYKNEPVFANSKIVYSVTKNVVSDKLGNNFLQKVTTSLPVKEKDIENFKSGGNAEMYVGGAKKSDVVLFTHPEVDETVKKGLKSSRGKKVLKFDPAKDDLASIIEICNDLTDE